MKSMYYIVYVKYSQVKKYRENTILSAMRAHLLKEPTILSTLERFNLWALNELHVCLRFLSPQSLGQLSKAWDGKSFLDITPQPQQSLLYITVRYPNIFYVCQVWEGYIIQIKALYTCRHSYIFMCTHTYTQAIPTLHAVWDEKNNHT